MSVSQTYQDKHVLEQFIELLENDNYLRNLQQRIGLQEFAQILRNRLPKISTQDFPLIVAIIGEFKAGKSTIINALVGKTVAFVNIFEATSCSAFIRAGNEEKVTWLEGSKETVITLREYISLCQQKRMPNVDEVNVTVPFSLPLILIDTPGLGSISEGYEQRAESALQKSDLLLWVMDPHDLGSAQEGAFLRRAKEVGIPIWVILSKVDELTPVEVEECISYITTQYGYPRDQLIPLSAEIYISSGTDEGMQQLIERLSAQASQKNSIRQQAVDGWSRDLLDEAVRGCDKLISQAEIDLVECKNERAILLQQAATVKANTRMTAQRKLTDSMIDFLRVRLPELSTSSSDLNQVTKRVLEAYTQERLPLDTEAILQEIKESAMHLWEEEYTDRIANLQQQLEQLARNEIQDRASQNFLTDQLQTTTERKLAVTQGFNVWPLVAVAEIASFFIDPTGFTATLIAGAAGYKVYQDLKETHKGVSQGNTDKNNIAKETPSEPNHQGIYHFAEGVAMTIINGPFGNFIDKQIEGVALAALETRCMQRYNGVKSSDISIGLDQLHSSRLIIADTRKNA